MDDDAAALQASYPHAADYLRTSARLPGTSDPNADAAFDLRLVHFMTGDDSDNPYWDIVGPAVAPSRRGRRREVNGGDQEGSARLRLAQDLLQAAYAYAIPSPETLHWVAEMAEGRPVIEIGAGRGYWARQLARLGVDIAAYDTQPPGGQGDNACFPSMHGLPDQWHPVGNLRDLATARRERRRSIPAEHVLFLCWPPAWGLPMAHNALVAYERIGGDRLIYVGEHGGMCADERFFDALYQRWELAAEDAAYVAWWNLKDVAQCWVRKATRAAS